MHRTLLLSALFAGPLSAQGAWLVDSQLDRLFAVDLQTGGTTLIGSTLNNGLDTPADLCWRDDTNELFTVDLAGGEVGRFDVQTATFFVSWRTNLSGFQAMAWDAGARRFWLHNQNNTLYSLDPSNGALATIGVTSPATLVITAMEVDATGNLWAIDVSGQILALDRSSGSATVRSTTIASMQGLAFDKEGVWWAVDTSTDSLHRVDPDTGTASLIGANPGVQFAKGLAIAGTSVQRDGVPCADSAGTVRRMIWNGDANLGSVLQVGAEAGPAPRSTLFAFGFSASQAGAFALPLDLGPFGAPGCRLYSSGDTFAGPLPTGALLPAAIPALPALLGLVAFVQCVILDPFPNANAAGLAFTDVVRLVVRV